MRYVNLLAWPVTLIFPSGQVVVLRDNTKPCYVQNEEVMVEEIDTMPVWENSKRTLVGVPEPEDGVVYIAASYIARLAHESGRADVYAPFEGQKDSKRRIIGITALTNGL